MKRIQVMRINTGVLCKRRLCEYVDVRKMVIQHGGTAKFSNYSFALRCIVSCGDVPHQPSLGMRSECFSHPA